MAIIKNDIKLVYKVSTCRLPRPQPPRTPLCERARGLTPKHTEN